jgi:hypothetical protein
VIINPPAKTISHSRGFSCPGVTGRRNQLTKRDSGAPPGPGFPRYLVAPEFFDLF